MSGEPGFEANLILGALEESEKGRVFPELEYVDLPLSTVLYSAGEVMDYAYFPVDCIISQLYVMEDGSTGEIAVIGKEGMIGIALFMGGDSTPSQAIVQGAGGAFRLPAKVLKAEFRRGGNLHDALLRFTQALLTQMAQTAVCNRHHKVEQQLCRWLLLSLDRLPTNRLSMTQELIANMLGVRREGVTLAAGKLQRAGAIEYKRGEIVVKDQELVEGMACECYRVVKSETDRLMKPYIKH